MKKPSAISRISSKLADPRIVSKAIEAQKAHQRTQSSYEAPENHTEETVGAIWSKLLAIDKIGRNDNFFQMGGHSLLATQMLARVRDTCCVELPLKALFESPVLAAFSVKIDSSRNSTIAAERLTPQPRGNTAPLSLAQQRLWFLDQLVPGSPLYNVPQRYHLFGTLNREALQQTFDAVVRRHESLRTTFAQTDTGPVQVIAPELKIPVTFFDLTEWEEGSRDAEALRIMRQEAATPFDPGAGPMLRVLVIGLSDIEYEMVINTHHIVFDRWSQGILTEEITKYYRAACEGVGDPLPALPVQYADYAIWQRRYLEAGALGDQIQYWKQHLAGAPALIEFPTDRPRTASDQHRGSIVEKVLPGSLISRIRQLGQDEGCTLFMGMLAAFNVLLARYSGLEDIVVGSPIANRNVTEIEPVIGFFVGTLPLRTDLSGDPAFSELLRRVRETCLGAYANEAVPFERLVEELQPERSLSHNPVFQIVFALQPWPQQVVELPGLRMERRPLHTKAALFDAEWFAFETDDGILLRVEYNTDLFDDSTIVRAVEHFQNILEGIAAHPEKRISELSLLTRAEQRRLLADWTGTATDYPRHRCVHELFEELATINPHAPAVIYGDSRLTYGELNRRANQLAHRLRRAGVGPESLVAVAIDRSPDMILALLGILKAGGAYLPLDPAYPADRLAFMLGDAQVSVLLTREIAATRLPFHTTTIRLDADWPLIACEPDENPAHLATADNLAYVIYTSGSTGKPKGVEIGHRSLMNLCAWHQREYNVGPDDRATLIASPAFDASVWEAWPYLTTGAALHVPDEETRGSPPDLLKWLRREAITLTFLPTPLAEAVLGEIDAAGWSGSKLRAMLTGGDKLHLRPDPALPFLLVNHYGPTENTVVATRTRVTSGGSGTPPIGRPIPNTRVYVLEESMQPVPVGVAGELYIGGESLARGYRNRPDATAASFVPDPFSPAAGSRLYRTGDRVRYLADGNLEFLGRLDHQVKIRGFRIELGEIEAVLGQHPLVKECAVDAREDPVTSVDKRLVAYVVPNPDRLAPDGPESTNLRLRAWLSEKLPEYMVPSAFVTLDAIPLTANGKVDRRALPPPDGQTADTDKFVAPRTVLEDQLAAIWAEVLRRPRIGVLDDFFAIGGHSLLATQVISRVRKRLDVELPLRFLFESSTVEALAARIETARAQSAAALTPIPRVPRDRPIPASFAQQRLWFLDQLDPDSPLYNAPWTVRMKGVLRVDALESGLNEMVLRHEVFRTTFEAIDGIPHLVIADEISLDVPLVDLSGIPDGDRESEVRRLVAEDSSRPFNLRTGPVFRTTLLRLNPHDHVLLLSSHHIANDGWSLWRFVEELGELYSAFCEGRPSPLPELPIQYADYAVWQRSWMTGDVLEKQLAYWKKHLADSPDTLEMPTDHPRPPALSYRGSKERAFLPKSLADKLYELSRVEGATMFMTLLAAWQTLLYRYTGQEDIVVGAPIANRTRSDIEGLIGFFVNTMVMRANLSGDPTFRNVLRHTRSTALDAYANQDLPFEKLVETLQPDRYLGRVPLFQIWFALQNAPRISLEMAGLEITSMDIHNGTSKFDLGLFVSEKPGGLDCSIEYSTDLFDAGTIQRLLAHFQVLLESIAENPDRRIGELRLLPASEEHTLLVEWNDASRQFQRETCIHNLFELQAERTPDNVALVFGDRHLSYAELNQRSNQLAHRLRALGVGPETLVGICMERSLEMVIGVLGVLKAGGGYLPLDMAYPMNRLEFMLADSQVTVILTQAELLPRLPPHSATAIPLDTDWPSIASEPGENLVPQALPENVAYVIYTSGSTGKPKGCVITHANVARLFTATDHWFDFGPNDTWTLFHSIAFDFSVWEIWGSLLYGGKLVVVPRITARAPEQFHELLVRHRVTVLNQTPSAFRHLIMADEQSGQSGRLALRYVIFGGEALEFPALQPWFARHGDQPVLINMYGITETTVHVTYFKIPGSAIGEDTVSLIGRPIPDLQVYVLDSRRRPVPIGVIGEMYVGGYGVARGYLNRPELTEDKFVADPFHPDAGARLYRTGDLARFRPDGNLQYMGRIDHQVKIRGFRIELGEIETAIDNHPGVRQSVVVAREDLGDKRLVAYLVPDRDYRGSDAQEPEQALSAEQVARWTEAFDEAFRRGTDAVEATFNITGWDSSYTGEPIDPAEMRVWVESTVDRLRVLEPKRVWEIGCGTGLLLFRLAPASERYYGTDISSTALNFLRAQLKRPGLNLPQLTLEQRAAHEFDLAHHSGRFNTVVLNSVAQYFPDLDYFMTVLDGAVESVEPGGTMFIGDLRSFPLLEAFHTSVQLYQAPDSMTCAQFRQRVQTGMLQQGELLIDPELFVALHRRYPRLDRVEIQLKRGRVHNELTLFRYDVVLHMGGADAADLPGPKTDCAWLDWKKQNLNLEAVRNVLRETESDVLGVTNIPNARLRADCDVLEMLAADDGPATVGELRAKVNALQGDAIEPEDLWSFEAELPYRVEIRASKPATDGCCDAVFRRTGPGGLVPDYGPLRFPGETDTVRPWASYANDPLRQRVSGRLIPQVHQWLSGKLPEYMVPSVFVLLDAMPLTANGKVNRRALPAPDDVRPEGQGDYSAPRTPAEEVVAAIFADVLHIDRAGADDDFFKLGGHSLSATQVVSRARAAFGVNLSVRALFEASTVAALARSIATLEREKHGIAVPPLVRVPRNRALPLSFAQQRLWFIDQLEPGSPLYSIPWSARLTGLVNIKALETALDAIVRRHEILRTVYRIEHDLPVQIIQAETNVPLEVRDLSNLPAMAREAEARRIVEEEAAKPFDLAADTIFRPMLLKLEERDHVLFVNIHHIACDGWSLGVVASDLAAFYEAALTGNAPVLAELPVQYADFAVWQRSWQHGDALERQLGYWKKYLRGAPPVLSLPTDRPRPEVQTFRGATERVPIPKAVADGIALLSRQQSVTLFMATLAAFQCVIMYYTKQTDIVLGTDLAGRNSVETEALIGFFVNLVALRTDLSDDPVFTELLGRVRETTLGAYAHQDVPFDKLVEELQPERTMSRNPLVQVLFVHLNTPRSRRRFPGIELAGFPFEGPAKFDLAVFYGERGTGMVGTWNYNRDLFDVATIAKMAGHFQTVLEIVTANPSVRLGQILNNLGEKDQQDFQDASRQKLKGIKRRPNPVALKNLH